MQQQRGGGMRILAQFRTSGKRQWRFHASSGLFEHRMRTPPPLPNR